MSDGFYESETKFSNEIALIHRNKSLRYGELADVADKIGIHLKSRSTILIVCSNNIASVAGYIGSLRAKAVPLLVSTKNDRELFTNVIEAYNPSYIFLPSSSSWLNIETKVLHSYDGYLLHKTEYPSKNLHDDLALLLATSGSTGSPKFVRLSYKNISSNAKSIAQYLEIGIYDRPITTMPMSYSYGLSIINSHLLKGSSIVLTDDSLMDRNFWEEIKANNVTSFGGVPYSYEILKKLRFEQMKLPSLKYLTQAGGKLNADLCDEFAKICTKKSMKFFVMYGQTEASPRMSYVPWERAFTKAGSIGIPIPGGKFILEDENGMKIEECHKTGELVYQGENVSMGYAKSHADLSKSDNNNGKLHTGDFAIMDEDGYYFIVGRKERFLKMYGNRVNLDDVEDILKIAGYECACAGSDNDLKIYTTEPVDSTPIIDYISKKTGINKKGFTCINVDDIPRNNSGKVLYPSLC